MKCPKCGSKLWYAKQIIHDNIMVNNYNEYLDSVGGHTTGDPCGPYTCTECGHKENEIIQKQSTISGTMFNIIKRWRR